MTSHPQRGSPDPRLSGVVAAARHWHVLFVFGDVRVQRDFFVLDLSVRTLLY
jgi:hypothetical protein